MEVDSKVCGAMFCHEKIWWNNSEIFIDEMFVRPDLQQRGYGSELFKAADEYVKEHNLAGFTLSTNCYAPTPQFYKKMVLLTATIFYLWAKKSSKTNLDNFEEYMIYQRQCPFS